MLTRIFFTLLLATSLSSSRAEQESRLAVQTVSQGCEAPESTFAVIGDYGLAGQNAARVAARVLSWHPDFIITLGDNNYPDGKAETIDANIGQYYSAYIGNYRGEFGGGSAADRPNNFYPSLGNHDYKIVANTDLPPQPYLDYFSLPGNERYYHFERGSLAFFALNSNLEEPDGNHADSVQGQWLKTQLAMSKAQWKLVYMHHAPFGSRQYGGPSPRMRWPFQAWGADAVLAGHDHTYERFDKNGLPYFVNGLGGGPIYPLGDAVQDSVYQFNDKHAAMRVTATSDCIAFQLISHDGELKDELILSKE